MATIISREDADKMMVYGVGAAYSSNEYVVDGNKGGIALNNIASGGDGVIQARCVVEGFKKAAGAIWTEGQYLYFDPAAKAFTTVVQSDGLFRGRAYKDALIGAVVGDVEIIEPISDGEGKMDLAVPTAATNVATLDATGQVTDSTVLLSTLTAKQNLAVPTAAANLATLDALGQVTDSTIASASIAGAVTMGNIFNDQMRNSTNTAQSIADATAEIIDLEDVELAGDVPYAAGTTSLATIPTSGLYAIVWSAVFAAGAGTYNTAYLYVNGSAVDDDTKTPDNANPISCDGDVIMYLAANDTVALWCKQDSGGALNVTAGRLAIQRLQ